MWTMTSQRMGYCQGGVNMGHYHVQYVKINYVAPIYSMRGKCLGLIIIVVSLMKPCIQAKYECFYKGENHAWTTFTTLNTEDGVAKGA